MIISEIITRKISVLPPQAQREVLELVTEIEKRYVAQENELTSQIAVEHPLVVIGRIKIDFESDDLAERHDFYAHGKLEE